jgi:synaptojanin
MSRPSIRVLIKDAPTRSIALATETHGLILKNTSSSNSTSRNTSTTSLASATVHAPRCIAEFGPTTDLGLEEYRTLNFKEVFGTLGLITLNNDVFLCVVTSATKAAEVRPGESVQRINTVEFRMRIHNLNAR